MTRPEPRRSALSGRSPVDPPTAGTDTTAEAPVAGETPAQRRERRARGQRAPVTATPKVVTGKVQWTNYIDSGIREDARNAVAALAATPGGPASLAELVENAIEREVARLEKEFNHSEPFPTRSREMRRGRRIGEG